MVLLHGRNLYYRKKKLGKYLLLLERFSQIMVLENGKKKIKNGLN